MDHSKKSGQEHSNPGSSGITDETTQKNAPQLRKNSGSSTGSTAGSGSTNAHEELPYIKVEKKDPEFTKKIKAIFNEAMTHDLVKKALIDLNNMHDSLRLADSSVARIHMSGDNQNIATPRHKGDVNEARKAYRFDGVLGSGTATDINLIKNVQLISALHEVVGHALKNAYGASVAAPQLSPKENEPCFTGDHGKLATDIVRYAALVCDELEVIGIEQPPKIGEKRLLTENEIREAFGMFKRENYSGVILKDHLENIRNMDGGLDARTVTKKLFDKVMRRKSPQPLMDVFDYLTKKPEQSALQGMTQSTAHQTASSEALSSSGAHRQRQVNRFRPSRG